MTPSPCHTLSHLSGPPKVRHTSRTPTDFSSIKKPDKDPLYKVSLNGSRGFYSGVLFRVFFLEGFVRGGFCPFSFCQNTCYLHYNRKLTITFNFTFHMYAKHFLRVTSHALGHLSETVTLSWIPPTPPRA